MNFLGIFLAIGCIVAAMMMEGTNPTMMLVLPAFLVVFGASFFACVVQFPLATIMGALKCFIWTIAPPRNNMDAQVELLVGLSTTARQQGLLALENSIASACLHLFLLAKASQVRLFDIINVDMMKCM